MMLSPQAARMGKSLMTIRRIGSSRRAFSGSRRVDLWSPSRFRSSQTSRAFSAAGTGDRFKSTMAAAYDTDEEFVDEPAAVPMEQATSRDESWMINLGRNGDNEWLTGARKQEWFTGVSPRECPGADNAGSIRSLALPKLSAVTRDAAKEYFDNSWTLYETLFAGLKGEEGFYRYVYVRYIMCEAVCSPTLAPSLLYVGCL